MTERCSERSEETWRKVLPHVDCHTETPPLGSAACGKFQKGRLSRDVVFITYTVLKLNKLFPSELKNLREKYVPQVGEENFSIEIHHCR